MPDLFSCVILWRLSVTQNVFQLPVFLCCFFSHSQQYSWADLQKIFTYVSWSLFRTHVGIPGFHSQHSTENVCLIKISLRPDLKICWFAITRPGLQETYRSINFLMLIPEKKFFHQKYLILAMFTLESKVNFSFFLLHHFQLFVLFSSEQVSLDYTTVGSQINQWKASTAAVRNTNDEENLQM